MQDRKPPGGNDRLEALRALGRGKTVADVVSEGKLPRAPVAMSRELERVLALPLREPWSEAAREAMRKAVTRPGSTMRLWNLQTDALLAALEGPPGLFAAIAVGGGKTLIAALLGTVWRSCRTLVFTTASLRPQTRALIESYRGCFFVPESIEVFSYTELSIESGADLLDRLRPEVIIADEAHALLNDKSARGRRIRRYRKENPGCKLAMMTGTIARSSLMEWAELAHLALGDWSPAPRDYPTRKEWAEAVDPDPVREVGKLGLLADGNEIDVGAVRRALAERVERAPGCVASGAEAVDVPLIIRVLKTPGCLRIDRAREALRQTWERPDGEELMLATEYAEVDRQLRLGGYYAWSTEPDREWLRARRAYRAAVRQWINARPARAVDSPKAVERLLMRGEIELSEWSDWCAVRDRAEEPPKEWVWISDVVRAWVEEQDMIDQSAVFFVKRTGFGESLTFAPYFGAGNAAAEALGAEDGSRSIVCSLGAHGQGKNLQCFSRALVVDPPPSGAAWEQLLGRLHRPGQSADVVVYEIPDLFGEELARAVQEAYWLAESTGIGQKLQCARIEWLT